MIKRRTKTLKKPSPTLAERNPDWQSKTTPTTTFRLWSPRPSRIRRVIGLSLLIQAKKEELGPNALVITLWEEGFTLSTNPDELRPYKEPRNAKFMAELKQGVVPTEIRNSSNAKGLSVSLEDKRGQSFRENQKKKPRTFFGGKGVSLGGPSPQPQMQIKPNKSVSKISNLLY